MKFVEENKLLVSIIVALFMIGVVVAVFTTARMAPAMTKYTDKPFYEVPKAPSPNTPTGPDIAQAQKKGAIPFIDPIVAERAREKRGGVPVPEDIMSPEGRIPGVTDLEGPGKIVPNIPGYGPAPESPYDVLYDENSPFQFSGRPGRLGDKMTQHQKKAQEDAKLEKEGKLKKPDTSDFNDYKGIPAKKDPNAKPMDLKQLESAFLKILRTLAQANHDVDKTVKPKAVEGKVDNSKPAEKPKSK